MSKILKRRYKNIRVAFKKDLLNEMNNNKALAMLVIETYSAWHHRRYIGKNLGDVNKPQI